MANFQTDSMAIYEVANPVISSINGTITRIVPGMEFYLVIAISFFLAYLVKQKHNWNNLAFVSAGIIIFAGLRYLGVGG